MTGLQPRKKNKQKKKQHFTYQERLNKAKMSCLPFTIMAEFNVGVWLYCSAMLHITEDEVRG